MRLRTVFSPLVGLVLLTACTPEIGDKCVLSTDCSIRSDRVCDISQPNGYCTLSCRNNSCPDRAACVLFNSNLPGCGFDDRAGPTGSRVARSFCVAHCETNADCRTEEGYVCADPRTFPWNAMILDDDQSQKTCLVYPAEGLDGGYDASTTRAPVCGPTAPEPPPIDAGKARIYDGGDAQAPDAGADADAGKPPDGGDAGDSGADAAIIDAGVDALGP